MSWTAYWSERAEREGRDADRMAELLERALGDLSDRRHREALELLRDHQDTVARRMRALPAGSTKIGNLRSGGILQ